MKVNKCSVMAVICVVFVLLHSLPNTKDVMQKSFGFVALGPGTYHDERPSVEKIWIRNFCSLSLSLSVSLNPCFCLSVSLLFLDMTHFLEKNEIA
jgi:hypothetical protein